MHIILFQNYIGTFPYKNYNCSIILLQTHETLKISNVNSKSILINFFTSSSNKKRYGTMNWIGLINYESLLQLFLNKTTINFWIIKPHLLQNDLGPKCADIRFFKTSNSLHIIGYTRLAPLSNLPNIADYYVRTAPLKTIFNKQLFNPPTKLFHFNEIDGGCFPSLIKNNYKKFSYKHKTPTNNIEFYINNSFNSNPITPHKSKHKNMPNSLKLNGFEISFHKNNSNENHNSHIPSKNIIPLQHSQPLHNIAAFVDFAPHNQKNPILTIQNINNSQVIHTNQLLIHNHLKSKSFKGSTPIIQTNNNIWITFLHKKSFNKNFKHNIKYDYLISFFDSKTIHINQTPINIPNQCIHEIPFIPPFKNDFIFITGLTPINQNNNKLDALISYGISDEKSGISLVSINLP